jgi:hypothetical protein
MHSTGRDGANCNLIPEFSRSFLLLADTLVCPGSEQAFSTNGTRKVRMRMAPLSTTHSGGPVKGKRLHPQTGGEISRAHDERTLSKLL